MVILDHTHPKIIELIFSFTELVPAHIKSVSYQFIFEIQSLLESRDQISHTYFWPCLPKKILINF